MKRNREWGQFGRVGASWRLRIAAGAALLSVALVPLPAAVGAGSRKRDGLIFFWRANNILAIRPDGSGLHRVTHGGCQPSVSPDGAEVVFTDAACGGGGLYLMNANGLGRRSIPVAPGVDSPSFSPDGKQVVFDDYQSSIYSVNVDGSGLRRLHHFGALPHKPVLAPDGKTILFDLEPMHGASRLYLMDSNGANVRAIPHTTSALDASFSPNGKTIVFVRGNGIFRMSVTGHWLKRLTTAPTTGEDANPEFSPDGTKIVFERLDNGVHKFSGLLVMNAEGSHPRVLTSSVFSSGFPAWQPLG